MKYKKILVLLAAVSLVGSALSEPVDTEYLVDMTSEQVVRLEQRLAELGFFSGSSDSTYDAETRAAGRPAAPQARAETCTAKGRARPKNQETSKRGRGSTERGKQTRTITTP